MAKRSFPVGAPQSWPPPPPTTTAAPATTSSGYPYAPDCSQGICSPTCPQLCNYLIFPPPPPSDSSSSSSRISPLMAALIAVLAAAFLLLLYYTVISRFCRRRRRQRHREPLSSLHVNPMVQDPSRPDAGLDDSFIRQITVFKYRRSDRLVDSTDCAVCLSDFKEDEDLRLMPNCEHAFHIPCIDTWLRTHSSCPLCRSSMNPDPPSRTVAALRVQRSHDAVLVVREDAGEVVVVEEREGDHEKTDT